MADTSEPNHVGTAYDQLCSTYRAIDDFRAKLLGFLPLVTGGGLILLTGRVDEVRREFFAPVGLFGIAVTTGLLAYEVYAISKCHALIEGGKALEQELRLPAAQFTRRPDAVFKVVNEPFAAAVIYPAVLAAWTYLASSSLTVPLAGSSARLSSWWGSRESCSTTNPSRVVAAVDREPPVTSSRETEPRVAERALSRSAEKSAH